MCVCELQCVQMRSHETFWKCKKMNVSEKKKKTFQIARINNCKMVADTNANICYFGNILFIQEGFVFKNRIANFIFVCFSRIKIFKKRVYYCYIFNVSYLLFNYLI